MKIFCTVNGKGGVGKTTLDIALMLYACDVRGLRVLGVDLDVQANKTASFRDPSSLLQHRNSYHLMSGEDVDPIVIRDGLALIPASNDLLSLDSSTDIENYFKLGEALTRQYANSYDVVVIDTPGYLGVRTIAALTAADVAFAPTQLDDYSFQALVKLQDVVRSTKSRLNPRLNFAGVVPNLVRSIGKDTQEPMEAEQRRTYQDLLQVMPNGVLGLVGHRRAIADSFHTGQWITPTDESARRGIDEISSVCERLLKSAGL